MIKSSSCILTLSWISCFNLRNCSHFPDSLFPHISVMYTQTSAHLNSPIVLGSRCRLLLVAFISPSGEMSNSLCLTALCGDVYICSQSSYELILVHANWLPAPWEEPCHVHILFLFPRASSEASIYHNNNKYYRKHLLAFHCMLHSSKHVRCMISFNP